jgi:hypothetical protein
MSKRYKKQSLDSSLFHHGLIKMLLVHRLKTLGDDWDGFLARNGFVTTIPTETPMLDKPMIEKHFDFSSDKPDPLKKTLVMRQYLISFYLEQQKVNPELNDTIVHDLFVDPNANTKPCIKSLAKKSMQW